MSGDEDHLSNEISVEASLTESGVKATAKSRFLSAIDRMFGGMIDFPAAFFEGKAAEQRLRDQLKRRRQSEEENFRLNRDIEIMNLDKVTEILERERKTNRLINRAVVTVEALEDLRSKANDEEAFNSDSSNNIDDDWLNVFEAHAANASSDRLRKLWGRILSGEIRKPGSFSLTTLRVLSELDQQTAILFQKHVTGILGNSFLVRGDSPKGQELIEMTALEEVGLLQDVNGMLGADQEFDRNGQVIFQNGPLVLLIKGVIGNKFRVPLIKITRSGQEILGILPKESPDACLRLVAGIARPASLSIELALLISSDSSGRRSFNPIEKIL